MDIKHLIISKVEASDCLLYYLCSKLVIVQNYFRNEVFFLKKQFLVKDLWDLLEVIQESKDLIVAPIAKKYGLTSLQLKLLIELDCSKNLSLNSLATSLRMSNGNTSTLCKKLEQQGWIVRERRLDDERYISLSLSQKGREAIHSLNESLHIHYESFLGIVDEETISHIHLGLKELRKVIELINLEQRKEETHDAKRKKE